MHAGNRFELRRHSLVSSDRFLLACDGGEVGRHFHGENVIGVEARIDRGEPLHRLHEEPRAGEQNHRHGDLRDHQGLLQTATAAAAGCARAAGREFRAELVFAPHARREREQQRNHARDAKREGEHHTIHLDFAGAIADAGGERRQHARSGVRDRDAQCRAGQREDQMFREEQPPQPGVACAKRGAERHFMLAPYAAHQREIRDIGTGDDEHEGRHAHEQRECEP